MHRSALSIVVAAMLSLLASSCAGPMEVTGTRTHFGFSMDFSNAPPPPRFVYVNPPRRELVPGTMVYVVEAPDPDCDMFQYQGVWYLYASGYWYRSSRYDGSYVAVDVRSVPRPVLRTPPERWKHHPHRRGHAYGRRGDRD